MTGGEWVGGRRSAPFYVMEGGPQRPDVILWVDAASGLIVGMHLDRSGLGPSDTAECLARAIERPLAQVAPPASIRVGDPATAAAVRARLSERTPVIVGATHELDVVIAEMARSFPKGSGSEVSYLEGGLVSEAAVGWLFRSAAALWRVAPWKLTDDDQVLGVDVPDCGLRGGCLTIIGSLGENFGFVLFESFAAYERFAATSEGEGPDLRGHLLALSFERRTRLTATMRREIAEHRWSVAGARAHPVVMCLDPDGTSRPTSEGEVRLAAACTEAVAEFVLRHREALAREIPMPIQERIRVPREAPVITVRLAAPHPALLVAAPGPPALPIVSRAGRNDPCPCGSGKKYKRCHLALDEARSPEPAAEAAALLALDARLVAQMKRFGEMHHAAALQAAAQEWERGADGMPHEEQLLVPWLLFHRSLEGKSLVEHFLARRRASLSDRERRWLEAQRAARLSVWHVVEVDAGVSLVVEDLFTGERCTVRETTASRIAVPRDRLLARVAVHDDVALFVGVHPRALTPSDAARVVAIVKRALGTRAARLPAERLRGEAIGLRLAHEWDRAVETAEARFRKLRLTNTDGEPLVLTVDHFSFVPETRATVEERLTTVGEREEAPGRGGTSIFAVARDGERRPGFPGSVLVGRLEVSEGTLRVETNSRTRADSLRREVEGACGDLVRHRLREHADPRATMRRGPSRHPRGEQVDTPEAAQLVLEFKRRHYAAWLDEPIPALGHLTPREAAGRPASRHRLALLLEDMEQAERRGPAGQGFDFGWVRGELGLEG